MPSRQARNAFSTNATRAFADLGKLSFALIPKKICVNLRKLVVSEAESICGQ
jgi:hypothetical protein